VAVVGGGAYKIIADFASRPQLADTSVFEMLSSQHPTSTRVQALEH